MSRSPCDVCPGHEPPPRLDDASTVSVVVTHFEQPDDLARTLRCLEQQTVAPVEVIVTDDGSATPPRVPAGVRLLTQPDQGFRAALARNRAVEAARGDLVVLLDADTAPEPTLVERLTAPVRADPDVLAGGRRRHTTYGAPALDPAAPLRGALEHALPEPAWLAEGWAGSDDLRAADDGSFRYLFGAILAASAWGWRRIGGFDPTFSDYGGEDWDLAHRWWRDGGRLRHVPDAVAWHHGADAGLEPRAWGETGVVDDRLLVESLAVARRIHAAPVAFRGLRSGPPRVVVTHDDDLPDRELVIAVDGLLAGLPHAVVVSDRAVWAGVGDDRVRADAGPLRTASVGLHLHRGLTGDPAAWVPLAHPDDVRVCHEVDDAPAVTATDLRRLRRTHLGLEPESATTRPVPDALRPVGDTTLAAWLGGWG
ncbi:hypothetical protein GCM10023340_37290 [Nocardioides marinquilinus]|uniref:Glycosyltransferase n=1 Tax=Nocardioides marinquilinus TaxID=1210400 RepID=A0ABP9PZU7_9ACTN